MNGENRIKSLDGLRAFSIGLVIASHLLGTRGFFPNTGLANTFELGELGVRIFFVISGFLITSILMRELDLTGRIRLTKFYFRRTLRIFPAYYAFLLILILLSFAGGPQMTAADSLHALTYTSNYYPHRSWNIAHTWSLSVEEQFYLLWPLTLVISGKRKALYIAAALIVLLPLLRLLMWQFLASPTLEIGIRFETIADSIATGCILAGLRDWLTNQKLYNRILNSRLILFAPIAILIANAFHDRPRLSFLFGFTVMNIGIAVCIDWCLRNPIGKIGRVLNSRAMVFIGVMSYSVYLWQQIFLNRYSDSIMCRFPLNLVFAVSAALLSFWLIERPGLAIRQRLEPSLFSYIPAKVMVLPLKEGEI